MFDNQNFYIELNDLLQKYKYDFGPNSYVTDVILRVIENVLEYKRWVLEIPFIPFKSNWLVKPIPAFGGAIVRFLVADKNNPDKCVSVYLDGYGILGFSGFDSGEEFRPYWEIYPYHDDSIRVDFYDIDKLVKLIDEALQLL